MGSNTSLGAAQSSLVGMLGVWHLRGGLTSGVLGLLGQGRATLGSGVADPLSLGVVSSVQEVHVYRSSFSLAQHSPK